MVQSAVTDIIGPAVAAEDPVAAFDEVLFQIQDALQRCIGSGFFRQQFSQFISPFTGTFADIFVFFPFFHGRLQFCRAFAFRQGGVNQFFYAIPGLFHAQEHAQPVFRIVFKQGIGPGGTMSFFVYRIRHGRGRSAPDGRAARSVGNHHAIAEQLGHQFYIRCFATAGAGAGELQQRLFELGTFHRVLLHGIGFFCNFIYCIIPGSCLIQLGIQRFHGQRFLGSRADLGAVAAALAVIRRNHHGKLAAIFGAHGRFGRITDLFRFRVVQQNRTDGCMGAHKGALVALDAVCHIPFGNINSDAAFFKSRSANREGTVCMACHNADRQFVPFLPVYRNQDLIYERIAGLLGFHLIFGVSPGCRHIDLHNGFDAFVDSRVVHIYNVLALLAVRFFYRVFQILHCICQRNNICQLKERGLHDHVDAAA